jgi:hypothetical protein
MLGETLSQERIEHLLEASGLRDVRQRKLPLSLVVWLVVAMSLFSDEAQAEVLRRLMRGPRFLRPGGCPPAASKGAISQRRAQLGLTPLLSLFYEVCRPLATPATRGAFVFGLRAMALDGTTEDVADTPANGRFFGYRAGRRGRAAFPQVDVVYLCECGTHAIVDVDCWPCQGKERTQVRRLLRSVQPGMLVLWDAGLTSFDLAAGCRQRGAHFLCRVARRFRLDPLQRLPDGSYLAVMRPADYARRKAGVHLLVRVIEYRLEDPGRPGQGQIRRLMTSLLDSQQAPAQAVVLAYHERWELEITIDELDTHQRRPRQPLRSHTPMGVLQELYGLLLAHYAVRAVMHQAAVRADVAPDQLSFIQTVRILRSALLEAQIVARPQFAQWYEALLAEIGTCRLAQRDNRCNPRVVRRKMSNFDLKRERHRTALQPTKPFSEAVVILAPEPLAAQLFVAPKLPHSMALI